MTGIDRRAASGTAADRSAAQGAALVLASAFAFSTAGLFTRLVETDVWTLLFWRGVFGGLFIAAFVLLRDGAGAGTTMRRIGRTGLAAAACSALATICFINALRLSPVADVAVINATAPFMAAALAWAWTGMRERRATLVASLAALLGVALMMLPMVNGAAPVDRDRLTGDLLALAMTLLIAAMMVMIRHRRDVCMLPAAALSAFACALLVWPVAVPASPSGPVLLLLALFGVQFGLGLMLLTLGTRLVSATRSALIGAIETPLAPALVWLVVGEVPPVMTCVGGTVVLMAVVLDLWPQRRR
ncbi:DMT family transporter [Reyranella sp.]|uniref:DMT family transporter n=1 Tax=Reyranella sp. TaxID=1929291 RepID=UPI003BAD3EAE